MRIALHDYSGHPFQVQLSRELARRGHDVLHLHCGSYRTGKGDLVRHDDDPDTLSIESVDLDEPLAKYSPWKRPLQEREYALRLSRAVFAYRPDVVISSNNPLFAQWLFLRSCQRHGAPFLFWQQDVYSVAMKNASQDAVPLVGNILGRLFLRIERKLLRESDVVVPISEDFLPILDEWGIARAKTYVIENWAPLDELPPCARDNEWARAHDLADKRVVLYAGTLGLKHDPALLVAIARRLRREPDVRTVVISEGPGADWLRATAERERLRNLIVLPFQPYDDLPHVLASGDILTVILDERAAAFSVPSKVLSYHCAQRPILAAVPRENLAARIIRRAGSGIVVDPGDVDAVTAAAARLLDDHELRRELAERARRYALETFDIEAIADRFERALEHAVPGVRRSARIAARD